MTARFPYKRVRRHFTFLKDMIDDEIELKIPLLVDGENCL